MPEQTLPMLLSLAAFIAVVHTVTGPDHYLPFVAMSKAGGWTLRRTLLITVLCGVGHVLGSVLIGALGIAVGLAVERLEWLEGMRGGFAGWLLFGFGLMYMVWGLRRAATHRPHAHVHVHADGTIHDHEHEHAAEHAHPHAAEGRTVQDMTPWILFTIFVFGPCEPLIPILMVPAVEKSIWWAVLVVGTFAVCTIATMVAAVTAAHFGLRSLSLDRWARYSHAMAGFALAACGGAMTFLGL